MAEAASGSPRLAVACGGTGGHFYPGLSTAGEYVRQGGEAVLLLGGRHASHQTAVASTAGLRGLPIPVAATPGNKLALPLFGLRLLRCLFAARRILRRERIGVVLVMGSYHNLPVGLAAVSLGLPLVLHEANAIPGKTNRLLARWARVLALSLPLEPPLATPARQVLAGLPLRDAIVQAAAREWSPDQRAEGRRALGLDPVLPTLLVFGGSQGASAINNLVRDALPLLPAGHPPFQVVHLAGPEGPCAELQAAYRAAGVAAVVKEREERMDQLYPLVDLALCRAGAASLLELAATGRPALLIPFPQAAEDHQTANARQAVAAGGARLLPQADTIPEVLAEQLQEWLCQPETFAAMGVRMRTMARPQAAAALTELLRQAARPE